MTVDALIAERLLLLTMDAMMDIPPNIAVDFEPSLLGSTSITDQAASTTVDASPKTLDIKHTMYLPFKMSKPSAKTNIDPSPK
jgi:hypothetical protein